MYKEASKIKLRFSTMFGVFTIEDLWTIQLEGGNSLDSVAIDLIDQRTAGKSVVSKLQGKDTKENALLELKISIVEDIIKTRVDAARAKVRALRHKEKQAQITRLIQDKKEADLGSKSIEELEKMLHEESTEIPAPVTLPTFDF